MAKEIERRFLLDKPIPDYILKPEAVLIEQGYLSTRPCVRIRIQNNGYSFLTIKGSGLIMRDEYEWEIDPEESREMMYLAKYKIFKNRRTWNFDNKCWSIDEFRDSLKGLYIAELELKSVDEEILIPEWFGKEITNDYRYANVNLAEFGMPNV